MRYDDTLTTVRYCVYCYCIMRRNTQHPANPPQSLDLWRPTSYEETGSPWRLLETAAVYIIYGTPNDKSARSVGMYMIFQLGLRDTIAMADWSATRRREDRGRSGLRASGGVTGVGRRSSGKKERKRHGGGWVEKGGILGCGMRLSKNGLIGVGEERGVCRACDILKQPRRGKGRWRG
jgi:hypothetical protein